MPSQQGAFLKFEGHSSVFSPRPEGRFPSLLAHSPDFSSTLLVHLPEALPPNTCGIGYTKDLLPTGNCSQGAIVCHPTEYHIFQFSSLSCKHSRTLQSRPNFSGSICGTLDTMDGFNFLTAHTLGISWFRRTWFVHNNSILNHKCLQHCCNILGNPDLLDRGCQNHR